MKADLTKLHKEEAHELLIKIESALLNLEKTPEDKKLTAYILGGLHTIKGSASMFGFNEVAAFAHDMEPFFEKLHKRDIPVIKEIIDLSLSACDQLEKMINGEPVDALELCHITEQMQKDKEIAGPKSDIQKITTYQILFRPHSNIFATGTNPLRLLDELRNLGICEIKGGTDAVPLLKDLNPENCYLYWNIILTTCEKMSAVKDVFVFVEDRCKLHIEQVTKSRGQGSGDRTLGETGHSAQGSGHRTKSSGDRAQGSGRREQTSDSLQSATYNLQQTIKVSSEKLDRLMNLVGEMVTFQSYLRRKSSLQKKDFELRFISEGMERLTEELHYITMQMRMLPVGTLFGTFKRLVRDMSDELGKEVSIIIEGGDTELDKSILDRLNDPLVHMIRNSISHGIEHPDIRKNLGKPECGKIRLSATHSGADVRICISDDGSGIDTDKIREIAEKRGLIDSGETVSESEILEKIFVPGISTAEKVTGLSGRGVGMDVVKHCIDELRGTIEITSRKGFGTALTLKLPLTLAIIEGFAVTVGEDKFVFPLSLIEECVEMSAKEAALTREQNMMKLRGKLIPYLNLREIFMVKGVPPSTERIVIAEVDGEKVGFGVDCVIGQHQTVIKSLGKLYGNVEGISGATIWGDGTVALILDIPHLVKMNYQ
jgi:two-component system chemotaxis sensor kinase CheA